MGQDEGDVGPAHAGPHSQQPVHQVHQRPVLWQESSVTTQPKCSSNGKYPDNNIIMLSE